eukprot:c20869_g1_i5 orf=359-1549(+)
MVDQKASLSLQRVPARKARSERTSATSRLAWRGQNSHSWIRIDSSGNPQVLEVDRTALMKHCNLPARDLRLLDPLFVYPSTILGRQKAIVVNMERVRCIITADEVFLLNSEDNYALQYVTELQKRLALQIELAGEVSNWLSIDFKNKISVCSLSSHSRGFQASGSFNAFNVFSADKLPFEFQALEVALEATCVFLESQVRDELELLMDDDNDMAEMYLTQKKEGIGAHLGESLLEHPTVGERSSKIIPVSSHHPQNLIRNVSKSVSWHGNINGLGSDVNGNEELEMLLEAYFVVVDGTFNKLLSLKEYIDDTEDFLNIQLDNVQNQLIQFEVLLTTGTFAVTIVGVMVGVFGMNFPVSIFDEPGVFKWVITISGAAGLIIFLAFLCFLRWQRLMPL